jgi:hypothetical protein
LCLFFGKQAWTIKFFKIGKGGKRLQNANQEIELLQQDFDDSLQEIDRVTEEK